jgi:hypothetical protein
VLLPPKRRAGQRLDCRSTGGLLQQGLITLAGHRFVVEHFRAIVRRTLSMTGRHAVASPAPLDYVLDAGVVPAVVGCAMTDRLPGRASGFRPGI